ncbi:MAG: hypothetical protein ABIZ91_09385, partial [Gemmatimonadaceae bacterium]
MCEKRPQLQAATAEVLITYGFRLAGMSCPTARSTRVSATTLATSPEIVVEPALTYRAAAGGAQNFASP